MTKEFMYMSLIASMISVPSTYASERASDIQMVENTAKVNFSPARDGVVSEYDSIRDKQEIFELFKKNWDMLEGSSVQNLGEFKLSLQDPEHLKKRLFLANTDSGQLKVLRNSDELVGFIFYSMGIENKKALIKRLAINEKFKRKGCGQYLLNHAINDLKTMGACRVRIGVFANNTSAIKLYKNKMGFQPTQSNSHYIWLEKLIFPLEQEKNKVLKKIIKWTMILGVGTIALLYLVKKYYSLPKITYLLKISSRLLMLLHPE